jgi:hypothetical protein
MSANTIEAGHYIEVIIFRPGDFVWGQSPGHSVDTRCSRLKQLSSREYTNILRTATSPQEYENLPYTQQTYSSTQY